MLRRRTGAADNTADDARNPAADDPPNESSIDRSMPMTNDDVNARPPATTTCSVRQQPSGHRSSWWWRQNLWQVCYILLHVSGCALVAWGHYLAQTRLYTAVECDMTWSHRAFMPVEMNNMDDNNAYRTTMPYRLYKFADQRDPRSVMYLHRTLLGAANDDTAWCGNGNRTAVAVLYIPGHGGSYQQARSMGAHGIQLSRRRDFRQQQHVVQALSTQAWSGRGARTLPEFVYDVYTLDFAEEGGALHGALLERQAAFIAQAISHLITTCQLHRIYPIAHSMGGYALRLALHRHAHLSRHVTDVITLGTAHARPVWTFAPNSVAAIHDEMSRENNTVLISFSGGWRDEMIPALACAVPIDRPRSLTVAAVDVMPPGLMERQQQTLVFGMDHRAIVWCHNLLLVVRHVLFELVAHEGDHPESRLQAVRDTLQLSDHYSFAQSVHDQANRFEEYFGIIPALAVRAGLLTNVAALVILYTMLGAMRYELVQSSTWMAHAAAMVFAGCLYQLVLAHDDNDVDALSWCTVGLLSLVASSIHVMMVAVLKPLAAVKAMSAKATTTFGLLGTTLALSIVLAMILGYISPVLMKQPSRSAMLGPILGLWLLLWIPCWMVTRLLLLSASPSDVQWMAWCLPLYLVLAVSPVARLVLIPGGGGGGNGDVSDTTTRGSMLTCASLVCVLTARTCLTRSPHDRGEQKYGTLLRTAAAGVVWAFYVVTGHSIATRLPLDAMLVFSTVDVVVVLAA